MAHLVETMAYVGATPWHGLGNQLAVRQSLEVWAKQAGMDWDIRETPVRFITESAGTLGAIQSFPGRSSSARIRRRHSRWSASASKPVQKHKKFIRYISIQNSFRYIPPN